MSALFSTLIEKAQQVGAHGAASPITVLETAKEIAQHPDVRSHFADVVALVECPGNYYTRRVAIRVINLLGPAAVHRAAPLLRRRVGLEDFDLAKRGLENALAKIKDFSGRAMDAPGQDSST